MAMLIIGILMVVFGIYLFSLGYGNIGALIVIVPSALFVVGGLILIGHGLKAMNEEKAKNEKGIVNQEVEKENAQTVKSESQIIEQIREYKKLADDGIITESEFEEKKKQLLKLDQETNPSEADS